MTPAALSIPDAADYLGVSVRTVYRLAALNGAGKAQLPVVHIGGRRVFRVKDLDAFLARNVYMPGRGIRSA